MEGPPHDRISQLPDEVLHQILSFLPMKSVARAGVLSRRWNSVLNELRLHPPVLDFGQDFSSGKSPQELVGSINFCLRLHIDNKVRGFHLFFYPSVNYNYNVEKWVKFAVDKGVEDLELDFGPEYGPFCSKDECFGEENKRFMLPDCVYGCGTLTNIKLSRCRFGLLLDFTGFAALTELCLKEVNMTEEMLDRIILTCPSLEILSLRKISPLSTIAICYPNLQLKFLTIVDCYFVNIIKIDAPHLTSFHINASLLVYSCKNLSSLMDSIICAIGYSGYPFEYNRTTILATISQVKILTICSMALLHIVYAENEKPENLPILFPNLQELQIVFEGLQDDYLSGFYCFIRNCRLPLLERVFIELDPFDVNYKMEEGTLNQGFLPEHIFCNLRLVKINSFRGRTNEILLVEFLLARAIALEFMVLVASERTLGESRDLSFIHKHLLQLPKVSLKVQIILYERAEDDKFPGSTHTKSQYAAPYYAKNDIGAFQHDLG